MDPFFLLAMGFIGLIVALVATKTTKLDDLDLNLRRITGPDGRFIFDPVPFERPEGEIRVSWETGRGDPHLEHMLLRLDMPIRLPSLKLRPHRSLLGGGVAFEDRFVVRSGDAFADGLLGDDVRRQLVALSLRQDTWQGLVSLDLRPSSFGSWINLRKEGHVQQRAEVEHLVDKLCAIGRSMLEHWEQPWTTLRERWPLGGLSRGTDGQRTLEGELDGMKLLVQENFDVHPSHTLLQIAVPALEGIEMVHVDHATGRAWNKARIKTGNPVLDMLVAVRGQAGHPAVALLGDPDITDLLLPIIHGRRGVVAHQGLQLRLPGSPRDLVGPLDELLDLARALEHGEAEPEA